jgi:drug/metabolite transporter (DMT)-like permease
MLIKPDMTLEANPGGIFLLLFAVMSAVIYSVLVKKLVQLYRPVTIIAYQNLVGIFLFLPLFLIFGLDNFIRTKPTFELISALIELSVFASSLAFIFFTKAIRVLGVSRANVFSNLIPVFSGIFSYILVSETFSGQKITGMIIIMSGIIISQVRIRKTGLTST